MASAMRPAPTKPTRLPPDSAAAAAITPPRRASPPSSATPIGCGGLTCAPPLAAETSRSALSRGFRAVRKAARGGARRREKRPVHWPVAYLGAPLVCEFRK